MKVQHKSLVTTVFLAGILTITGCSSSTDSQVEPDSGASNSESAISDGIDTTPSDYQILKVLEPLLSSIVKYTDTDYGAEGLDPNFKETFPEIKLNFAAIMKAEANWKGLSKIIDYQELGISGLESSINAYNAGLDQWIAHQQAGMARWQSCLDKNDEDFQMLICTTRGMDMDQEQSVLDAYIVPSRNLLEKLGLAQ